MHYRIFSTWRLIAALVIMLYHFCHYGPEGARDIIEHIERMLPMLDMFFIISGYLIFDAYRDRVGTGRDYYDYIVRRFARIYPLILRHSAFSSPSRSPAISALSKPAAHHATIFRR